VGNDDNSPMNKVVGGGLPAQIWAGFMKQVRAGTPKADWQRPAGVIDVTTCGTTGLLATPDCPDPHPELFIKGTEPESYDQSHAPPPPAPADHASGTSSDHPGGSAETSGQPPPVPATGPSPAPAAGSLRLTVTAPEDGAQVDMPFPIKGMTVPGATVHIAVNARNGSLDFRIVDVDIPVDPTGNFSYSIEHPVKPAGSTLTITVSAVDGQESATTTLSVREP